MRRLVRWLACALALLAPNLAQAETLIHSVKGYTLNGLGALTRFEALLLADDGTVKATGKRQALARRSPQAQLIDGKGRTLLPGLVDTKVHVMDLGLKALGDDPGVADEAQRAQALAAALATLARHGLTSVHDAGTTAQDWALFQQAGAQGKLSVRIHAMIAGMGNADWAALSKAGPQMGLFGERLSLRAVRLVADGGLDARAAALLAPYADAPDQKGQLLAGGARLRNQMMLAVILGYQVAVEATGDAANREALDAFGEVLAIRGSNLRHRISQASLLDPVDLPRFAALGLIAAMQPAAAVADRDLAEARLGPERAQGMQGWARLAKSGARLAFGSGAPERPVNPFIGLHAAVTAPGGGMSLTEALRAYTLGAAFAGLHDGRTGALEPGKWADFILIDRDIFAIPPAQLKDVQVLETWVAGQRVFAASP